MRTLLPKRCVGSGRAGRVPGPEKAEAIRVREAAMSWACHRSHHVETSDADRVGEAAPLA